MMQREWTGMGHAAPTLSNDRARKSFELFILERDRDAQPIAEFDATEKSSHQVTPQVGALLAVMSGENDRETLQLALGLKDRAHFRQAYLSTALEAGLIEMTIPEKPTSRMQRYRLTDLGRSVKEKI